MELQHIFEKVNSALETESAAREKGLGLARNGIRLSANSIRAAHRGDREECHRLLSEVKATISHAREILGPHPRIYHAGFLQDAEKEYAEACATAAMIEGDSLPLPDELGVGVAPYLNGLGEAVGEMRRHVLDLMRTNKLERGEELLGTMDDIYYLLASLDYPDAITGGLRRTNDMVRGVLERTRGDLTTAIRRDGLEKTIRELEVKLAGRDEQGR
ncbi:MAG: haloacid dehalogenase [Actinobacteria bacterium]|nr:haloacid dehalogenase [Actinomycetota bacterium]